MIQKVNSIIKSILKNFPNQKRLPTLIVITSTACNLDCKDCGNCCPFIKPKQYNAGNIIADIKTLTSRYIVDILQI